MAQLKVMVIEDEELLLSVITKKLENSKLRAIPMKSGEEAILFLKTHSKADHPNLIWLDYHLKGMDGLIFMNQLKTELPEIDIPVFVISNSANDETQQKLLEAGAKKYLLKAQFRLDDILYSINKFLESK